jgi:hypothetical protein
VTISSPEALEGLIGAFQDPELGRLFASRTTQAAQSTPGISSDNAKHIALVETILQNRDKFPPQSFSIRTDLGDGASIDTFIPPLAG